jgi:CRP/FNR family transcriptional regulator
MKTADEFCHLNVACEDCGLSRLCLAGELSQEEVKQLGQVMTCRAGVEKGDHLFHANDQFDTIYAIRAGTIQSYLLMGDGQEQITGFHLAGELLGLEAISSQHYLYHCKALERSSVCEIHFQSFSQLAHTLPKLQQQLLFIMSNELAHSNQFNQLFGKQSARSRLVSFLLNMSARFQHRGFSATQFHLSMRRCDIAHYMGMNIETVSRIFSQLQQEGLITAKGRYLHLLDMRQLKKISLGFHSD